MSQYTTKVKVKVRVPSREAMGNVLTVFGITWPGIEPTTFPVSGQHSTTRPLCC